MSAARSEEWTGVLAVALFTVDRVLKTIGLGLLKILQPDEPVRPYQWALAGDMIHVNTIQLARLSASDTGSPKIAGSAAAVVPVMRRLIWQSTTPHGWPMSRCCKMRSRQPRFFFCAPWPGSLARASTAGHCSRATAAPTASNPGEKPSQHSGSYQNVPGRTRHKPTSKPSSSSKPCWRSRHILWPFRPQLNVTKIKRYLAIYNDRKCHMALDGLTPFERLGLLRATE